MRNWWRGLSDYDRDSTKIAVMMLVYSLGFLVFILILLAGTAAKEPVAHEIWCPESGLVATTDPGSLAIDGPTLKWTKNGLERMSVGDKCYAFEVD